MTKELLENVSRWRVEAKFEDVPRYFFRGRIYEQVLSGDYSLVTGRKGTGKTAIAEYICRQQHPAYSAQKLSFKNFPFNELYKLADERFTHPNQYITIWKFVALSFICRLMSENEDIDPLVKKQLEKAFGNRADLNLASIIQKWTLSRFNLSILGNGAEVESSNGTPDVDWIRSVEKLESIVARYGKGRSYFLVFDELDEDFKDVIGRYKNDQYLQLITSLIKAVSEIRSLAVTNDLKIHPIIFLRDDIYDFLRDNDKNKFVDVKLELLWDAEKIKQLLAFRISKSIPNSTSILSFDVAWDSLFEHKQTRYGLQQKKSMSTFDFIARSTHMRPRDFIRYLQVASQHELEAEHARIQGSTLRHVDAAFSPYLRDELVDEIESVLPEIQEVLDVISEINKQRFGHQEFYEVFERRQPTLRSNLDAETCLKILFHFSVVGNSGKGNSPLEFFKYEHPRRKLNVGLPISVHRGLFKALEIV
jgi:hypothetical protein